MAGAAFVAAAVAVLAAAGAGAAFGELGRAGGAPGLGTLPIGLPGGGRGAGNAAPLAADGLAAPGDVATRGAVGEPVRAAAGIFAAATGAAAATGGGGGGAELSASLTSGGSLSRLPGDALALDT
jgi:hypothetical protein